MCSLLTKMVMWYLTSYHVPPPRRHPANHVTWKTDDVFKRNHLVSIVPSLNYSDYVTKNHENCLCWQDTCVQWFSAHLWFSGSETCDVEKTHMSVHCFISNTTKPHTFHNGNGKKPYVSVKRFEPHGKKAYISNCRTYAFLPLLSATFQWTYA